MARLVALQKPKKTFAAMSYASKQCVYCEFFLFTVLCKGKRLCGSACKSLDG
jgi:hypothetical protein